MRRRISLAEWAREAGIAPAVLPDGGMRGRLEALIAWRVAIVEAAAGRGVLLVQPGLRSALPVDAAIEIVRARDVVEVICA